MSALFLVCLGVALAVMACAGPSQATLTDRCIKAADAASCDRLGELFEKGALPVVDADEAGLYFALACEGGVRRACDRAQRWALRYPDYEVFEVDVGCMLRGDAFACEEVAATLREDEDEPAEHAADAVVERRNAERAHARMTRALALYRAGCERDEAESCFGASRVHAIGLGDERNPALARAELQRACSLGLAAACERAGDDAAAGDVGRPTPGVVGDVGPGDAVAFYAKACDLGRGSPHACLKLAHTRETAGAPIGVVAASYVRACELLAFDACLWISQHEERLDAASPATVQAFGRWCDTGEPRACAMLTAIPAPAR